MDTSTLRDPMTVDTAATPVCAAFVLHRRGRRLDADGMESWFANDLRLTSTDAARTVASAPAIPLLGLITQQSAGDR